MRRYAAQVYGEDADGEVCDGGVNGSGEVRCPGAGLLFPDPFPFHVPFHNPCPFPVTSCLFLKLFLCPASCFVCVPAPAPASAQGSAVAFAHALEFHY